MVYNYRTYNKIIQSEIPLPLKPIPVEEANSAKLPEQSIITLKRSALPGNISPTHEIEGTGISYSLVDDHILITIERTALFKIIHQNELLYDASLYPHSSEKRIGLIFLHLILQFLISGSSHFLFHGSAVSLPGTNSAGICSRGGGALILLGEKGAGKSTLAAALSLSGCSLLCDDIVPIVESEDSGIPAVLPGISRAKLLPDAYKNLIGSIETAALNYDGISKYYTDLPQEQKTVPLTAVLYLEQKPIESVEIQSVSGMKKFQKLIQQTIRIEGLDTAERLFETVIGTCRDIPIYQVTFPKNADPWVISRLIIDKHGV